MKTKSIFKLAFFALFAFIFAKPMQSQVAPLCNYRIDNRINCNIVVNVDFYDASGLCKSYTGQTVNALSNRLFNCAMAGSTCGVLTDVKVTLVSVGGNSVATPNSVNASTAMPFLSGTFTTCGGAGTADMQWNPDRTVINPLP